MKKVLVAIVAALTIAGFSVAVSTDAEAQRRHYHRGGGGGGAVAAGIIGGLAVGAMVGAAAASRPAYAYPAYRPAPGYVAYDGYYAAGPVGCPGGYWARRPVRDQWGNVVRWSRPRFICP